MCCERRRFFDLLSSLFRFLLRLFLLQPFFLHLLLTFANAELNPVSVDGPEGAARNASDSKVVIVVEVVVEDRIEIDELTFKCWLESFLD